MSKNQCPGTDLNEARKLIKWDYQNPFVIEQTVEDADIDIMGHTNNVVYLRWLEKVAWKHSASLGLDWEAYQLSQRAMVARRHELDYLCSCFAGEQLGLATWIVENDHKLTIKRAYQVVRYRDRKTLLRGLTTWVCVDLKSGKPKRMPPNFVTAYQITAQSVASVATKKSDTSLLEPVGD